MAHYLELIEKPYCKQGYNEGVEHHFEHQEQPDAQRKNEHRSEETDERDAIGEHCHRMTTVADCLEKYGFDVGHLSVFNSYQY